jgi:hypothetical protein
MRATLGSWNEKVQATGVFFGLLWSSFRRPWAGLLTEKLDGAGQVRSGPSSIMSPEAQEQRHEKSSL